MEKNKSVSTLRLIMAKKLIMAQYFASVAEYKESVISSQPKNKVVRFLYHNWFSLFRIDKCAE